MNTTDDGLRDSVLRKVREGIETQTRFFESEAPRVAACARDVARAVANGGRVFALGNGGSACDAAHFAVEFSHPIVEKRRAIPAMALGADRAFVSAVGNDEDFALAFVRELVLHARPGDVVVGFSTSGKSRNVIRAMRAARDARMLTVGLTGRDGGALVDACEHVFVVPSFSTHRIQETHAMIVHLLWDLVHVILGEEDVL